MNELESKDVISPYGYEHWSRKPVTPQVHEAFYVPQTIMDGWQCFCSCGRWRGFESFYEVNDRDALLAVLDEAHQQHAKRAAPPPQGEEKP